MQESSFGNVLSSHSDEFSKSSNDTDSLHSSHDEKVNEHDGSSDPTEEDLFNTDQLQKDYEARPDLDYYDPALVDDTTEAPALNLQDKRYVDEVLNLRDSLKKKQNPFHRGVDRLLEGTHSYFVADNPDADEGDANEIWRIVRERRERFRKKTYQATELPLRQVEQAKEELPYCRNQVCWTSRVGEILNLLFTGFFCLYNKTSSHPSTETDTKAANDTGDRSQGFYLEKLTQIVHADASSVIIEWEDLRRFSAKIVDWIYFVPVQTLQVLDDVATQLLQERFTDLYRYRRISCRLRGYPTIASVRSLNTRHLNHFVSVRAVIIRRSNVLPKLKIVYYQCNRCLCSTNGPYEQKEGVKLKIKLVCEDCQATGSFTVCREKTLYENYQHLTIQEPPSRVVPGHVPRQKQAIVLNELVDKSRPGDEVILSGIFLTKLDARLNATSGFPTFATYILVNNLERRSDMQINEMNEEDIEIIHRLSQNKHIREKIIDSIAPSLWGHRLIKTGLAYAMFGGVERVTTGNHVIRGDINFLILGDPGMGKSQFLKYVEKIFDRTVYTTGKGASAVGLTAAVRRDPTTGEWCLEGGGLVLADEGLCLIDEFDKMSDQDRVSIHEAMEQQSISISKAGIVATLRARCAVIAAANPILGHYDSSLTFSENVDLSDPILSRFDILSVVKDTVNPIQDENLADHVVTSHAICHPHTQMRDFATVRHPTDLTERPTTTNNQEDLEQDIHVNAKWVTGSGRIPQSFLKKYINYARRHSHPELRLHDEAKLARFYSEIRQASLVGGGIPMTVRHLESIIRMACANAKFRLASVVTRSDIDFAMSTMLESFIQSQKHAVATSLGRRFGRYRALATSPEEFLESVLFNLFHRKSRDSLRVAYKGKMPEFLDANALKIIESVQVSLAEWISVTKTLYSLPQECITKFCETSRFLDSFCLKFVQGSVSGDISQIMVSRKQSTVV